MKQTSVRIQGIRGTEHNYIWVNGVKLDLTDSLRLERHSLDGFDWGYGGSGPAQAALGICLALTNDGDIALELHQSFKWSHVCKWPLNGDFDLTVDFEGFLAEHVTTIKIADLVKNWRHSR